MTIEAPLSPEAFVERMRAEGAPRYHVHHSYHTRIPIKDAIILSKSEDPAFRRMWLHRIVDHDGAKEGEGGIELWLRLADGVGLARDKVRDLSLVLPPVRFACDAYVQLVREK